MGLTTNSLNTIESGDTLTTDKCDFSGTNKIIIESSVLLESFNSQNQNTNRLDEIYVDVDFDSKIKYTNNYPIVTNTSTFNELNLILKDENCDFLQTSSDYDMKLLFKGGA